MSLPGQLINIGGHRVFYHRSGKARPGAHPLVLVHGYLVSHWEWRHVIPRLAEEHDVIALDLPGWGESDRPPAADYRYDPAAYSESLIGLLDALAIDKATLIGHSMGGGLVLFTAARRPERVDRVVAIDPLVYPYRLPIEARIILIPVIGQWIFRGLYTRGQLRSYFKGTVYRDPTMVTGELIDYMWERLNRPGGFEAAHASLRIMSKPTALAGSVRAVRAPTLVVWGEEDKLFPSSWARRLAGDIAGAQVAIIAQSGHAPNEERPDELARVLREFVGQPELRAGEKPEKRILA